MSTAKERRLANLKTGEDRHKLTDDDRKKGGKKSAEIRRQKKTVRELFQLYGDMRPSDKVCKKMLDAGFDESDLTNTAVMVMQAVIKAQKGDVKAMQIAFDYLAEEQQNNDGGVKIVIDI